jgi:hypothetical protein
MPRPPAVTGAGFREPSPREIGGLFASEAWLRDRYIMLSTEARGYRHRPWYHPDWQPSVGAIYLFLSFKLHTHDGRVLGEPGEALAWRALSHQASCASLFRSIL